MLFVSLAIVSIYAVFILTCLVGWLRNRSFTCNSVQKTDITLSLIVCCKNEEKRLSGLLASIEGQIEAIDEVIFASDHSTDSTESILNTFAREYYNITVFATEGNGKKNALREAIAKTDSDYILCTDADCILPDGYLNRVKQFLSSRLPDLMIGAVKYTDEGSTFGRLQALDFASLAATTAGAALADCPIMCNGANLAFGRDVWEKAKGDLVDDERSGDDMFLMHSIKKSGGTISFLKSPEAFVETAPARTLADFLEQRKRWASKSRHYTDPQTIAVAILVALVNVSVIISIAAAFCDVRFLSVFVLKLIIDCCLLIPFLFFSRQRHLVKFILPLSIIYPFYTILTVILSTCGRYRWKEQ